MSSNTPFSLYRKDKEPVPWEFPSSLAFSRMNAFFRRVQTIEVRRGVGSSTPFTHFPDFWLQNDLQGLGRRPVWSPASPLLGGSGFHPQHCTS